MPRSVCGITCVYVMKRNFHLLLLSAAVLLSSCSYSRFAGVATGSTMGGMLGSSIGGIMGGPLGSDKGTLAGMLIGGTVGAVVTAPRDRSAERSPNTDYDDSYFEEDNYNRRDRSHRAPETDEVQYGKYRPATGGASSATMYDLQGLRVSHISFVDSNGNRCLDRGEEATLIFDVYNESGKTLYNVTPHITCNNRRVTISAPATVERMSPGRGIRYKTVVSASRRLGPEPLTFTVSFGRGSQAVQAKTFTIRTR